MKQCEIQKGEGRMITWLPEQFTILGSVVRVKEDREWSNGWTVVWVSEQSCDEASLPDAHEYRKEIKTRK